MFRMPIMHLSLSIHCSYSQVDITIKSDYTSLPFNRFRQIMIKTKNKESKYVDSYSHVVLPLTLQKLHTITKM